MACFLAPAAEAIVSTAVTMIVEKKEKKRGVVRVKLEGDKIEEASGIPFSRKLKWLNGMLWGGSALLAFEHVWHGEVVPWFPFLTAAADKADASVMLHEIATTGATMAVLVTAVWLVMLGVSALIEKRAVRQAAVPSPAEDREAAA